MGFTGVAEVTELSKVTKTARITELSIIEPMGFTGVSDISHRFGHLSTLLKNGEHYSPHYFNPRVNRPETGNILTVIHTPNGRTGTTLRIIFLLYLTGYEGGRDLFATHS